MQLTKVVKQILILNIIIFTISYLMSEYKSTLIVDFVLFPIESGYFQPLQLLTYMFLHSSLAHILFNMIALVLFGPDVERRLGSSKFLKIYLLSGIFSGLSHLVFMNSPVVGASGAIWSIMIIYTLYNPNNIFNVYFIIPIKIKYIASFLFLMELYLSFNNDGVSHIAHIGGAIFGFIAYKISNNN